MRKKAIQGQIFLERGDLLESLFLSDPVNNDLQETTLQTKSFSSRHSNKSSVSNVGDTSGKPGSKKSFLSAQLALKKQQEERAHEQIQRSLALKRELDEKKLGVLSSRVKESMHFLDHVDKELELVNETKRTKTKRQFEEWNQNVHGEIQRNIATQVNRISAKDLHLKKNEDYNKFLQITNQKPAIFRDIIIEAEYDPLEVNRAGIRIKTARLKDPTNIDQQKADSENSMLPPKRNGAARPPQLCKETLPAVLWSKLEGTPYGRKDCPETDDILFDGNARGSSSKEKNSAQRSNIILDHFNFPTGKAGRLQLAAELPRGKATFAKKIYANPKERWSMAPEVVEELRRYTGADPEDLHR